MARKRMISQAIWDDPEVAQLSRDERLLFIGFITYADDFGHLIAHPRTLRKWVFGFDDDVTTEMVTRWRDNIIRTCRNVRLYVADGQEYIELRRWEKYQDLSKYQGKPIYPLPPEQQEQSLPESPTDDTVPASTCQEMPVTAPSLVKVSLVKNSLEEISRGADAPAPAVSPPESVPSEKKGPPKKRAQKHPLVILWHERMKAWPNSAQEAKLIATVTDEAILIACMDAWLLAGYRPNNMQGVLDWYVKGGPPEHKHPGGNGRGNAPPHKPEFPSAEEYQRGVDANGRWSP